MSSNHYETKRKEKALRLNLEEGWTKKSLAQEYYLGKGTINCWLNSAGKDVSRIPKFKKKTISKKKSYALEKNLRRHNI
ncbi:hypothetical protein CLNEO_07710 [Anaerotignum neopropionicum]|uniref:Transposase n=1 Tax=Anaerotignum neopropionicum TaxID=36847 RepID=A0A136WGB5_9FIRM|nr:hypothetical protein [Anaerotignum neopropionicum]KXL53545.1 hypothetical protein CLNEO_07710 [Anaerotignum neopropionicum]